jgi:hypothetical protein
MIKGIFINGVMVFYTDGGGEEKSGSAQRPRQEQILNGLAAATSTYML